MDKTQKSPHLSNSEIIIAIGHVAISVGLVLTAVGTSLKIFETGKLPPAFGYLTALLGRTQEQYEVSNIRE